jgi:hypothetical protein
MEPANGQIKHHLIINNIKMDFLDILYDVKADTLSTLNNYIFFL